MIRRAMKLLPLSFLIGALAFGCSSTSNITDSKVYAENLTGKPNKVLVVAVTSSGPVRKLFEKEMKGQIERHDVAAERSVDGMPQDDAITREAFDAYFADKNIDAVLVTRIVDVEKVAGYADGDPYSQPPQMLNTYYDYYFRTYDRVADPGHYAYAEVIRIETSLWDVESEKLIWQSESKSFKKNNTEKLIGEITKLLAKAMKDDGVL